MNQRDRKVLRVIPLLLIAVLILPLTACKSKEPITADAFKEKVEGLQYTAIDTTDQYVESPHVLKASLCEDDNVHVEFLEIDGNDYATAIFNESKARVEGYKGNSSSESSVSTSSYQKYTLKTSDKYYFVEQVGATLLYAYSDKTESEKLNSIIKELGY